MSTEEGTAEIGFLEYSFLAGHFWDSEVDHSIGFGALVVEDHFER